jgi:sec-independent protein translocase protein TatA
MLGLDNPIHLAFLLILLLLVFGAKRLPEMGRSLGAGMRGFRDSLTGEGTQPTHAAEEATAGAPAALLVAAPVQAATPEGVAAPVQSSGGEPPAPAAA